MTSDSSVGVGSPSKKLRSSAFERLEKMASDLCYIREEDVKSLLKWDDLFSGIEQAMSDLSSGSSGDAVVIQPPRGIMAIPHKRGALLSMPVFAERKKVLACKIVTSFTDNPKTRNLPSILANILVLDSETGGLKAIVEGTTITEWRTACASAVATKHLSTPSRRRVLGIVGAGRQGRIHIIAFGHFFRFDKINLWNRTREKALKLAEELKEEFGIDVDVSSSVRDCTKDADVIVTATYSSEPLVRYEDVKPGVLINAVGAGVVHHSELHRDVYEKSVIITDSLANARIELKGLIDDGFALAGEVGNVINSTLKVPEKDVTIFHSLGMAVEDGVAAELVYKAFLNK